MPRRANPFPVALVLTALLPSLPVSGGEWQTLRDCQLIEHPANDGDSFHVRAGDRTLIVRLYFVDCPETTAATDGDAKRVREQALHFGLRRVSRILHYGEHAREFVARILSQPFTVHTTFATAFGRSATPRVYALVTTADGKDLGTLLVENGLARPFGVKRRMPDGTDARQMAQTLADLEAQAMKRRVGIWAETDWGQLDTMRARQSAEESEREELRRQLQEDTAAVEDINTATARQLQSIPGIGPVLASRIMEGRPYQKVDDLLRVPGINQRLLEQIRSRLTVTHPAKEN